MLREYALDPNCLKDWRDFRYFMDQFGVHHGRLISKFPKYWLKMVHEACTDFTFIQRQKMADMLDRAKKRSIVSFDRQYNGNLDWRTNAIDQHQKQPFHAVITENNNEKNDRILTADEIEESTLYWQLPREISVERTAEDLAQATAPLLQISSQIIFIDKFFEPGREPHLHALQKFIETACENNKHTPTFEYHCKFCRDDDDSDRFSVLCNQYIAPLISRGINIEIFKIDDKPGGEGMHARYILTDRGGIKIDWGLDISRQVGQKTIVSILDESLWEKLMITYKYPSDDFEVIYNVSIEGRM